MSNINAVNASQSNWPEYNQQPAVGDKEPLASTEIQKPTEDIEKEETELKQINQEFSEYLSDGVQDKAKLKSAEMTQKQMQIQSMRSQIDELENPGKDGETAKPAATDSAGSGRPKFDRFIKSGGQPEETPGLYHMESDENGKPKIVFDRSEAAAGNTQAAEEPAKSESVPDAAGGDKKPEENKESKDKSGWGSVNTDRVDAETRQLKEKASQLEQQLQRASKDGNEGERKRLEAQLSQANAELSGKDTDAYRKANASVTQSSKPM